MTFKNSLESNNQKIIKAQSSVEYIVLFAIIASLTLLSVTQMLPRMRTALDGFFWGACNAMH